MSCPALPASSLLLDPHLDPAPTPALDRFSPSSGPNTIRQPQGVEHELGGSSACSIGGASHGYWTSTSWANVGFLEFRQPSRKRGWPLSPGPYLLFSACRKVRKTDTRAGQHATKCYSLRAF